MVAHNFSVVLLGNCLLLLSSELEERERCDALDAQLFAWLNASSEFLLLDENDQWHGVYMDRHTGLGWVVSTSCEKNTVLTNAKTTTPLAIAWSELTALLPADMASALNETRLTIQTLPSTQPMVQVLNTEALEYVAQGHANSVSRLAFEIRVVLPGPRVVSSSLFLEVSMPMDPHWLMQPLSKQTVKRQVTRHFAGELFSGVFDGIRVQLKDRLATPRAKYIVPLNV
ncbi:MAG: hypothetical protein RSE94_05800 [Pseudomonas sp.]